MIPSTGNCRDVQLMLVFLSPVLSCSRELPLPKRLGPSYISQSILNPLYKNHDLGEVAFPTQNNNQIMKLFLCHVYLHPQTMSHYSFHAPTKTAIGVIIKCYNHTIMFTALPHVFEGKTPDNSWHLMHSATDGSLPWPGVIFGLTISSVWYWCSDQVCIIIIHYYLR